MSKVFFSAITAWALIATFSSLVCAPKVRAQEQSTSSYIGTADGWTGQPAQTGTQPAGPAPRHDIFGIWDPASGGIQPMGAAAMPEDGKSEHQLPYTPAGLGAESHQAQQYDTKRSPRRHQ